MSSVQFFCQYLIAHLVLTTGWVRRKSDGSQSWKDYFRKGKGCRGQAAHFLLPLCELLVRCINCSFALDRQWLTLCRLLWHAVLLQWCPTAWQPG